MRSKRRGFALIGAVLAIVCIGATLAGVAFVARQDSSVGTAHRMSRQAFTAAELAAWTAAASLDSTALQIAVGGWIPASVGRPDVDTVRAGVFRLAPNLFLALGEAAQRGRGGELLWGRVGVILTPAADSMGALRYEPLPGRAWVELP